MNSNISNSETSKSLYSPFVSFTRKKWTRLLSSINIAFEKNEINSFIEIGSSFDEKEVQEVYKPLCCLINSCLELKIKNVNFKPPFIFGISGSVSVGKSTTANLLCKLLSLLPSSPKVQLVTTDSFLYPNAELKKLGLMQRKGFPETYDQKKLLNFIHEIRKKETRVTIPLYSHMIYDIARDKNITFEKPDILLIEGLNVFTSMAGFKNLQISISDFFDLNMYIDAKTENINSWYVKRFTQLKESALVEKKSYFRSIVKLSKFETKNMANIIWKSINEKNLKENILPMQKKAHIILKKNSKHKIDLILLKNSKIFTKINFL